MTMAHRRKLPSRASPLYWLPRSSARAKPFQCCPSRVWRCLRRGSDLPAGSGGPANPEGAPKHAPSAAPPHEAVTCAVVALLCRPPRATDDANALPACACAGGVRSLARWTCLRPRAILLVPHPLRLSSAFLEADLAIDHLRPHPGVAGRLLVHRGTQVSRFSGRQSLLRPRYSQYLCSIAACCPNFKKPCSPPCPPLPLMSLFLMLPLAGTLLTIKYYK